MEWREVQGHVGYRINSLGEVESCRYGSRAGLLFKGYRSITPNYDSTGKYLRIDLVNPEGRRVSHGVHRLVYAHFVGPIPAGMEIDHADRNPLNNSVQNLRLASRSQNVANSKGKSRYGYKKGTFKRRTKWEARTSIKGKTIYLGLYDTEDEAHAAYCEWARDKYKQFACEG